MTTYLTRDIAGQTHHFRVTLEDSGVSIVEGIFYNMIDAYYEGQESADAAISRQKSLVEAKLKEGYEEVPFEESPENSLQVYDQAKWHFEGDYPEDLDQYQAYVHTGLYLGWLVDNHLVSEEFLEENKENVEQFKTRKATGPKLFQYACDGVLLLNDLNETGNRFSMEYFSFETGEYLDDYNIVLAGDLPSQYHVADSWENYNKLKPILDKRFLAWKEDRSSSVE